MIGAHSRHAPSVMYPLSVIMTVEPGAAPCSTNEKRISPACSFAHVRREGGAVASVPGCAAGAVQRLLPVKWPRPSRACGDQRRLQFLPRRHH
jgi:hypothetical protein